MLGVVRRRRNVTRRPVLTTAPGVSGPSAVRAVAGEPRGESGTAWRATTVRGRLRRSWSVTRTAVQHSLSGRHGASALRWALELKLWSKTLSCQSCGGGSRQRDRHCEAGGEPVCDCQCFGPIQEFESCGATPCPEWSPWSSWSSKFSSYQLAFEY